MLARELKLKVKNNSSNLLLHFRTILNHSDGKSMNRICALGNRQKQSHVARINQAS